MTREQLMEKIGQSADAYESAGRTQEWVYWVGSGLAAASSAIAGASIAGDLNTWWPVYGKAIAIILAIVPAIWIAVDKTVGFRRLFLFNYGIGVKLRVLHNDGMAVLTEPDDKELLNRYNKILEMEHQEFNRLLNGGADQNNTPAQAQPNTQPDPNEKPAQEQPNMPRDPNEKPATNTN